MVEVAFCPVYLMRFLVCWVVGFFHDIIMYIFFSVHSVIKLVQEVGVNWLPSFPHDDFIIASLFIRSSIFIQQSIISVLRQKSIYIWSTSHSFLKTVPFEKKSVFPMTQICWKQSVLHFPKVKLCGKATVLSSKSRR